MNVKINCNYVTETDFHCFCFYRILCSLKLRPFRKFESVSVEKSQQIDLKPFRVLVIIGDQWTDPLSYAIDGRRVKSEDFLDVINMLKIWGVPFDILRLDQQRLQINRFLDGAAKPNYGCIVWMADPAILTGSSANYETLKRAVNEYGISLIGLFDYIKTDQVAELFGYQSAER